MGEPDNKMHNYAFSPHVAEWLNATSLASQPEGAPHSPTDDFYAPPLFSADLDSTLPSDDMAAAARQRQQTQTRSTPRPSLRSASGPATTSTSSPSTTRATQIPANRPTVKSLAQRFNQSPDASPAVSRVRPARPAASASSRATTSPAQPNSASSSPARPTKEASYGSYKFSNLKPRERPQPAPATPGSGRRANGGKRGTDEHASPSRSKVASPARSHKSQNSKGSIGRPTLFGEVIGDPNDAATPGYGIPTIESTQNDQDPGGSQADEKASIATEDAQLTPPALFSTSTPLRHRRSPSGMTASSAGEPRIDGSSSRRHSPPSRIPVPTGRRRSITSDSSSSTRSLQTGAGRGIYSKRRSPVRTYKPTDKAPSTTLPTATFREYRHRGKSPKGATNGASLTAVITAPPHPTSPRLRNSRERQLLPRDSVEERSKSADRHADSGVEASGHDMTASQSEPEVPIAVQTAAEPPVVPSGPQNVHESTEPQGKVATLDHAPIEQERSPTEPPHLPPLQTSTLEVPQDTAPTSSNTDFSWEESPILGMPGSFLMTPPMVQNTPPVGSVQKENQEPDRPAPAPQAEPVLLPALSFQPLDKAPADAPPTLSYFPEDAQSEMSMRESIPIMLGADDSPKWSPAARRQSPRINIGAEKWRAGHLDTSVRAYCPEDDSPIDPFAHRGTLRPDDSASVAFYHSIEEQRQPEWTPRLPTTGEDGGLTLDSEAYSVINKVLNTYHESEAVTPQMAQDARQQVQEVSPIIAQHKDWGSKEATETYLARLLSDANNSNDQEQENIPQTEPRSVHYRLPSLGFDDLDTPLEAEVSGTAIIFPPESRRYSRGSRGSVATTIFEDSSRADGASVQMARERSTGQESRGSYAFPPQPPPKDWRPSSSGAASYASGDLRASQERAAMAPKVALPEVAAAGEGLGLSLQSIQQQARRGQIPPPRPNYTPPPPPGHPLTEQTAKTPPTSAPLYTPSVYSRHPPSSIHPSMPVPTRDSGMAMPFEEGRRQDGGYVKVSKDGSYEDIRMSTTSLLSTTDVDSMTRSISKTSDAPESLSITSSQATAAATDDSQLDATNLALRRRFNIVREFLETEHGFGCDMMVVDQIFQQTSESVMTDRERRTLFSNSHELQKFSHGLYRALKKSVKPIVNSMPPPKIPPGTKKSDSGDESVDGESMEHRSRSEKHFSTPEEPYDEFVNLTVENDRKTTIGAAMNENMQRLERLYTTYLLNHEDANEYLKSNIKNPKILGWQMACIKHSEGLTKAWDLDSLLVKPTQRLMKYPLLLDELKKVTAEDHPDYAAIEAARQEIIQISVRINQAKKRQETLREATKEGKKEKNRGLLENRFGKNFVKALTSKTDKIKQQVGVAEVFDDPEYNSLAQRFGGHFFQLQIVLRDVEKYLEDITGFMTSMNCLVLGFIGMLDSAPSSSPELESMWRRQAMALFELQSVALEDHKSSIRNRILKPVLELWSLHGRPQKLMEQRKKGLLQHVRYKQALDKKEKIDSKLQDASDQFLTVNNALKLELPQLYSLTKKSVIACLQSFILYQKEWWKNCQKKILPLLEYEPEHTTSMPYDLKAYVDRFQSDYSSILNAADRLAILNHGLLTNVANFASPVPTFYSDETSSRKSSSRRTESISSDISMPADRHRRSGGYTNPRGDMHSFESARLVTPQSRVFTSPAAAPAASAALASAALAMPGLANRAISPVSDRSDVTVTQRTYSSPAPNLGSMDSAIEEFSPNLNGMLPMLSPVSQPTSSRGSAVFNSALPMSDSPIQATRAEESTTQAETDEPEVLFLAASLFEFNIAHDRREGGIPYLVYVPGEIFDVIGMKGELWLARNQDDASRTVGWIWEKHFARILPEDA